MVVVAAGRSGPYVGRIAASAVADETPHVVERVQELAVHCSLDLRDRCHCY